ncbi:HNH endonuclease (plasmid) [Halorarum halophilum]|uniref:HNH endonuclease n=1 Tax=Halorarum halophilum TaxID=2743090 RepID=A0A7D5GEV8_9EURY|nr:HNH endonuclease [Halobaculum halophilum]QLG30072.1 HNH endonuclease [Halobaculum halophilum]
MVDYGPTWDAARLGELERCDYTCQGCGREHDPETLDDENGVKIHVHHKVKARLFPRIEDAHYPENLIALCSRCHGRVESGKLPDSRPDVRDDVNMY